MPCTRGVQVDLSKPMMMLLNNAVGMLPCLVLAFVWGEHTEWRTAFHSLRLNGAVFLVLSCLNGLAISYAGIRLQHMVAATTFMVITNVNKFAVILFGVLMFGDVVRARARLPRARCSSGPCRGGGRLSDACQDALRLSVCARRRRHFLCSAAFWPSLGARTTRRLGSRLISTDKRPACRPRNTQRWHKRSRPRTDTAKVRSERRCRGRGATRSVHGGAGPLQRSWREAMARCGRR